MIAEPGRGIDPTPGVAARSACETRAWHGLQSTSSVTSARTAASPIERSAARVTAALPAGSAACTMSRRGMTWFTSARPPGMAGPVRSAPQCAQFVAAASAAALIRRQAARWIGLSNNSRWVRLQSSQRRPRRLLASTILPQSVHVVFTPRPSLCRHGGAGSDRGTARNTTRAAIDQCQGRAAGRRTLDSDQARADARCDASRGTPPSRGGRRRRAGKSRSSAACGRGATVASLCGRRSRR